MKTLILPAFFALVTLSFAKVEVFEISKNNVNLLPQGKEADGTRVDSARVGLEAVEERQRPPLRRARHRAHREGGANHVYT